MKKTLLYFFAFIFIIFILPALLTNKRAIIKNNKEKENNNEKIINITNEEEKNVEEEKEENYGNDGNNGNNYDYKKYGVIKLLHKEKNEIEDIELDKYICNVVSAEMPADYEIEALKAQAIVARTYTIYKVMNKKHENADICDDSTCCQAWISKEEKLSKWEEEKRDINWNKIEQAVKETKGKIITYNNKPINAFFHANSGGTTETPVNVWGGEELPYLQTIETAGEEGYKQYFSEVEFTEYQIIEKMKTKYDDITIDFNDNECIKILDYTSSNRVKTIKFGNHNISGVEARQILGLKSTNFTIDKKEKTIIFRVKGYGHGVGMSQTGADYLAKQGKTSDEIIHHFYKDIEIKQINDL